MPRIFQNNGRLVRKFGLAQSFNTQILFTVEVDILFGDMVGKFIVNHCVRSVYAGVGLFHMYSEGILVDGHSESEGGNFAVYMQDASGQSQFFKIVEGVDQCATFVARSFMLVAVVGLTPFGFQVQTFLGCGRE